MQNVSLRFILDYPQQGNAISDLIVHFKTKIWVFDDLERVLAYILNPFYSQI